jgi:hypothetical protein
MKNFYYLWAFCAIMLFLVLFLSWGIVPFSIVGIWFIVVWIIWMSGLLAAVFWLMGEPD